MKSLLILTQYYPPEIGAPQNRLHELAVRMADKGFKVEVLTAMPNYPTMEIFDVYKNGDIKEEFIEGIKVYRSKIYVSKSKSIISRLLNYFSFVYSSHKRGKKLGNYDFLMVESPPLFLGYSAMKLAKKLNAKLIFNVSDLWPESAEKMGVVTNKFMLKQAYKLEEKCYHKATLVTGQTQGIVENIKKRFPKVDTYWLPNGVDISFYKPSRYLGNTFRTKYDFLETDVIFFYGGILGYAQGLSTVLQAAKLVETASQIKIVIQGAGPLKEELKELNKKLGLKNVYFHEPVPKSEMPEILKSVDVALVPLRKLSLFEGAIPSKIFEALAMEIPLLLGVDGEARTHFEKNANAALFCEPENENDLAEKMLLLANNKDLRLNMGRNGREYVSSNFNRDKIAEDFISELLKQ